MAQKSEADFCLYYDIHAYCYQSVTELLQINMDSQSTWTLSQPCWKCFQLTNLSALYTEKEKVRICGQWILNCRRTPGKGFVVPVTGRTAPLLRLVIHYPLKSGDSPALVPPNVYEQRTKRKYITYNSLSIHEPKINSISMLYLHHQKNLK